MAEIGPGASLVRGIGSLFWITLLTGLFLAVALPRTAKKKALWVGGVLVCMIAPLLPTLYQNYQFNTRQIQASKLFFERCKLAGEKIYRTVDKVEGVLIVNPRTEPDNYSDQFKLDDPYGFVGTGDNYIRLFIRGRPIRSARLGEELDSRDIVTYQFAEIMESGGQSVCRYSTPLSKTESERLTRMGGGFVPLRKTCSERLRARYGIEWSDISTREDRDNWIAGGRLRVIDVVTNEVLGERVGYMRDPALGSTDTGRSPWLAARSTACPPLDERNFFFFDRVIKPLKEEIK